MKKIAGVVLKKNDNIVYYYTNDLNVKKNLTVIVETEKGLEFGKIVTDIHPIEEEKLKKDLNKIVRIATKKDYMCYKDNKKKSEEALKKSREIVKKLNLDMNIIEAHYTFDKNQLIFEFYSDTRVDFRDLARELAYHYKTRIELHQIGVRDKAKKIGGYGQCGQPLCCSRFLKDFNSVGISMAKNQNLSLNPSKINGVCGRLLCCLNYENDCYKKCRVNMPSVGDKIKIAEEEGKVISIDILKQTYKVQIGTKVVEIKVKNESP